MQRNALLAATVLASMLLAGCKRETKEERFARECRQFTQKECPKKMIEGVMLDSLTYDLATRVRSEYYTVEGSLESDSVLTAQALESLHEAVLKDIKNNLQLKTYKDEGITFRYVYYGRSTGNLIFEMAFSADDYGN